MHPPLMHACMHGCGWWQTRCRAIAVPQLGHMPQEDFPEAIHEVIAKWLRGETDTWSIRSTTDMRMTKKGAVNN